MAFRKLAVLLLTITLIVPVAGSAQSNAKLFVGKLDDEPDKFVGLLMNGENVTLYLCDGNAEEGTVTVAQWFVGEATDDLIDITTANGIRAEVMLEDDLAAGKITFADGTEKAFALKVGEEKAALFRSEFKIGTETFVAGWLVLEDGSVRGAILNVETGELTPASLTGLNALSGGIVPPEDR